MKRLSDDEVKKMVMDLESFEKEQELLAKEAPPARNSATGEWYGPKGPEPTRYADWEQNGRCTDFS